jgi:ferredoxin
MGIAEHYFDVDDDGVVVVLRRELAESDRPAVQEAVNVCPVSALRIDDD